MEPGGCKRWQSRQVDESQKLERRAAERLGPIESTIAIMHGVAEAGMVHLRLVVPGDEAPRVLEVLERSPAVVNLVRLRRGPRGGERRR
jgi:hypothetical protein